MQVVFAHHRAGTPGGPAGQMPLLQQHDLPRSHAGQVHGDACPVDAAPDDDRVRQVVVHALLSVAARRDARRIAAYQISPLA